MLLSMTTCSAYGPPWTSTTSPGAAAETADETVGYCCGTRSFAANAGEPRDTTSTAIKATGRALMVGLLNVMSMKVCGVPRGALETCGRREIADEAAHVRRRVDPCQYRQQNQREKWQTIGQDSAPTATEFCWRQVVRLKPDATGPVYRVLCVRLQPDQESS